MTTEIIERKTFAEVLDYAYGGIAMPRITNRKDGESMFTIWQINGIGITSYPIYKYTKAKTKGFLGFFKRDIIIGECLDVTTNFNKAVNIFAAALKFA